MKDEIKISNDGTCVYLDTKIKTSWVSRIVIPLVVLFILTPAVFMAMILSDEPSKEAVFGLMIYLTLVGGFILRFALWKLFGAEEISISKKSIRYQRHYGMFSTKPATIKLNGLSYTFQQKARDSKGEAIGNILFYSYDEMDQSELVFESTVHISRRDYENMISHLQMIEYNDEVNNEDIINLYLN